MLADVVAVLARAFETNPLHRAAFGADALAKNDVFFRNGLQVMKGPKHVAVDGSRVIGFVHWVESTDCQVPTIEKALLLPGMVTGFGMRSTLRVMRWLSAWSARDPGEPHVHLGPIGVDPAAQGRGAGRSLMARYCEQLDRGTHTGYLETDRPENVAFYRRFGFDVVAEILVLGVPNYVMLRGRAV